MTRTTAEIQDEESSLANVELDKKLDAAGWGLFFLWIGVALLADVGWGVGLLGVGIITLGEQAARRYYGLELEGFWILVGILFSTGGVWELAEIEFSMVPIVLIVAGVAIFASAFRQRDK